MLLLNLHNIKKVYGEGEAAVTAVAGISLHVKRGEIVLIMGPSGSGKTTLLSIAGGILRPTEGTVNVKDMLITEMSEKDLPKVRLTSIGFIFQAFNLLSALTALENIELVASLAGIRGGIATERAKKVLGDLGLGHRLHAIPADLSGGEKQRVAIARALVNNPDIILADEPTANLDSKIGHEVVMQLRRIAKDEGKSVIIVSHDQRIRDIADRVLWLEDGRFKELEKMATDPVCGMSIEKGEINTTIEGTTYYFCSTGCKNEFKEKMDQ